MTNPQLQTIMDIGIEVDDCNLDRRIYHLPYSTGVRGEFAIFQPFPPNDPLVKDLLAIGGIERLSITGYSVAIEKGVMFAWEDLQKQIIHTLKLRKHLASLNAENTEKPMSQECATGNHGVCFLSNCRCHCHLSAE